ncbi:hypothetical protein FRB95_013797 [Tulasnella sp. JGI-2019a]|nr:hypothetical protein FRB95_013797 [Tulasnella sp. JGI-2019a]
MQALIRRKKWLAAESWGLRQVVEALPTLLLISVGLFFAALSDLLWFTNKPVALVVIAITAIGAASYGFTMIAGALDTFCPYQFAGSAVIRKLALESITILSVFSSSWRFIGAGLQRFVGGIFRRTQMVRISSKRIRDAWRFVRGDCWIMVWTRRWKTRTVLWIDSALGWEDIANTGSEDIPAQCVAWMLENAAAEEDIIACVENIPALSEFFSVQIVSQSPHLSKLVQRFGAALNDLYDEKEGSEQAALILGRALWHVVSADPVHWAHTATHTEIGTWTMTAVIRQLVASAEESSMDGPGDLVTICAALHLTGVGRVSNNEDWVYHFICSRLDGLTSAQIVVIWSSMRLSFRSIPIVQAILSISEYDSSVGNFLCLEAIGLADGSLQSVDQISEGVWSARKGTDVLWYITKMLKAHDEHYSEHVDPEDLVRFHTEVLRYCRRNIALKNMARGIPRRAFDVGLVANIFSKLFM